MALTNKQKNYIKKNLKKHNAKVISDRLKIDIEDIENFKNSIQNKKTPKWFYAVPIFIPILFFILLEGGLRLFNYGEDYTTFIQITDDFPNLLFLNPDIPYKYFSNISTAPSVFPDGFEKVKSDSTFRVFVMGGSSAAGWPFAHSAAFSRHLKRRLELLYPHNKIEVINLGIAAVNSFTLRDFLPDVLKQKPDLILFYFGHNEYYGALGVASAESFGNSRYLTNLLLSLENYKTTQLVKSIIKNIYKLISSKPTSGKANETLMEKMIGESAIPLNSELYWDGINQFKENFTDMLTMLRKAKVNVIIGTLESNLLKKPFISVPSDSLPKAITVFDEAKQKLAENNLTSAKNLFYKAKDLDGLRFRAPTEINNVIEKLANKFNYPLVNVDSVFNANSPNGIVGYNLTVDHLHPNVKGYDLLGKIFYTKMLEMNYLPEGKMKNISFEEQNKILKYNFPFTQLDSTVADYRLRKLLGAYPFVPKNTPNYLIQNIKLNNKIDSTAAHLIDHDISWTNAHYKIAKMYLRSGNIWLFKKEINAMIDEFPFDESFYVSAITPLIKLKRYSDALPFLIKLNRMNSNAYTNKWLGAIELEQKHYNQAISYFKKSIYYSSNDAQVFYNLAGAYYFNHETKKALTALRKSISLKPNYKQAISFYNELKRIKQ